MNFVLGFGSTEQQVEQVEEDAIRDFVIATANEMGCDYFTEELVARVRGWCEERAKASQTAADKYRDSADHPDRYSSYWSSVVDNASNIVVILKFHHINRRHALSPDGWGLLQTKRLVHIDSWDLRRAA